MKPQTLALIIFGLTYLGIAFGSIPGLVIDRTGIALLGAIAMIATGLLTTEEAFHSIDISTILLLYGLMVLSAQFRLGGFYTKLALGIVKRMKTPEGFLLQLMVASAVLSAILANDIICLAFTPVVSVSMLRAGLNPVPFLIALAVSSNIGSASTIIGNPQNMLIGQTGGLHFGRFLLWCTPPSALSLILAYLIILLLYKGRWHLEREIGFDMSSEFWPEYNHHHSMKAVILTAVLMVLFFTPFPRDVVAISVAGILLCSRYINTRQLLSLVDWHLITLFVGLFIIIGAITKFGLPEEAVHYLQGKGIDINNPFVLTPLTVILSNIFSNVPAVMLLLKNIDLHNTENLYILALSSTYAGNLITIGSIANLITIEQASRFGITISFREYARTGIPVTITSISVLLGWILMVG